MAGRHGSRTTRTMRLPDSVAEVQASPPGLPMAGRHGSRTTRTMRLPDSVAEVQASPPGPEIGAFFDLDGTLVAGFTGVILTQDRFRSREIGIGEFLGVVQSALNHQLGRANFEDLVHKGASMLRGRSLSDLDEIGERLFVKKVASRVYPEMREIVRAHM